MVKRHGHCIDGVDVRFGASMRIFAIDRDMDHAGAFALKESFNNLAGSPEEVCLDFARVRFLDSAGVNEMIALSNALGRRSLSVSLVHAQGQPLRVLRQSLWGSAGPESRPRPC
jgi:anti-anti-sigma regulatory factor